MKRFTWIGLAVLVLALVAAQCGAPAQSAESITNTQPEQEEPEEIDKETTAEEVTEVVEEDTSAAETEVEIADEPDAETEEVVDRVSTEIGSFLWRLGYRKVK